MPFPSAAQDDILSRLTLEQRVAQMFMVNLYGTTLNADDRDFLARWQPGGVVLMDGNAGTPEDVTRLTNSYQQIITDAGGLPLLIAVDQEGGPIAGLEQGFTQFPTPALLTATGSPVMAAKIGAAIAEELRAVGVNMNLAPVADLENPDNTVLARRSFGSDPRMTRTLIGAFVYGTQSMGVLATAKHFPGHGGTSGDSHTALPIIDLSREQLEFADVIPFLAAIRDNNVAAIMAAHILYPAYDDTLPASLSPAILTGLLRNRLDYDGLILTDALDMDAIDTHFSYPEAAVLAIQAGADILLSAHIGPKEHVAAIKAIESAVRVGTIPESRIDDSVRRILDVKQRYGLLNWQPLDPATASERLNLEAHDQLLDDLFLKGVTVAVDRNNLIPITLDYSAALVYPATRIQIANECKAYRPDLKLVGVSDSPSSEEIAWAQDAAGRTDVTIVFTQNAVNNADQQALVNALPPEKTAVVALWSPYDWKKFPDVSAYVVTYSPARPAVPAACAILFGAAPANGKLSIWLSDNLPVGSQG